jgi:hypothetical protein
MTEEVTSEVVETPQLSEAEQTAMAQGWLPKDQWEGEPEDWIPARQFLRNGELFGRINTYKHKVQSLEKSVEALVKHNEQVFDAGYKAALEQLKAERRVALRDGDVEAVEQIEERMDELKTEATEKKEEFKQVVTPQQSTMHPAWEPWVETNNWYSKDAAMRGYADGEAKKIVDDARAKGANIEFDKLLVEVSRKVKERFPEKFGSQQRTVVKDDGKAGAGGSRKAVKSDDIEANMSSMEIELMNTIVRSGVSKEKYLEDYKKVQSKRGR